MGLQDRDWYREAQDSKRRYGIGRQARASVLPKAALSLSFYPVFPALVLMAAFALIAAVWYAFLLSRAAESPPRFEPSSVTVSAVAGCIQLRDSCKCLDQDGADVSLPVAQCLAISRGRGG